MSDIYWQEDLDDDDNTVWTGLSPYSTSGDPDAGPDVYWRLSQRLRDNKIEWYANHDSELGGETGDVWLTADDAKAACQKCHDHIISTECEDE